MSEWSVLGLPLRSITGEDLFTPLDAIVIVKGLNHQGDVKWYTTVTDGLNCMEIEGMLRWAVRRASQDE